MSKHYMNNQIIALYNEKYSYEQIASAYDMDVEQIKFIIEQNGKEVNLNTLSRELEQAAKLALLSIIKDPSAEKSDIIAASKIVLTGCGQVPDVNAAGIEERFKNMKQLTVMKLD
jgi:hypothetical protein